MFNKFKNQLSENSGFGSSPSIINSVKTNRNNSTKKIDPVESGVSEDNQSSDDNSSQKSQLNTTKSNDENLLNNKKEKTDLIQNSAVVNETGNSKDSFIAYKAKLQELNRSLLKEIDSLHAEINQKNSENEDLRGELAKYKNMLKEQENKLFSEFENSHILKTEFQSQMNSILNEKEELLIKNAELSQKYESLKLLNSKQLDPSSLNNSFDLENGNNSKSSADFTNEIKSLKEELNEKNKIIKNLQHRLNDLKKTLQKELKYHMLPNEKKTESVSESQNNENCKNLKNEISPTLSTTSLLSQKSIVSDNISNRSQITALKKTHSTLDMSILHDDVNFKYLKHVVLKFLTSREYEAIHLVKALSVLLNLSKDEETIVKSTLEWKMSWFGVKPKPM